MSLRHMQHKMSRLRKKSREGVPKLAQLRESRGVPDPNDGVDEDARRLVTGKPLIPPKDLSHLKGKIRYGF